MFTRRLIYCLSLLIAPSGKAAAVDFAREVFPVLQRACLECHGETKQKAGLRMDSRVGVLKGGESGPAIVVGKSGSSELVRRIGLAKGHDEVMPSRGDPLARSDVERIRAWIDAGAVWPDGVQPAPHWAYVKPIRPALPQQGIHPIDALVQARLKPEGIQPSPEAEPAIIARRLSLDLIGLPPLPQRVEAFAKQVKNEGMQHAVEAFADELLASPQYGEKWARPWLDAARYADSHGFQRDDLHDLWPYRDWVISSLNHDMPFDQFSIEQLAGDLLPNATEAQRIATGFNRCAPCNVEAGTDPEENRVNQVLDRVNTLGAVWLGTTLECSQCHNHKFDPFSQRDYYGLFAFFNNTALEADRSNPKVPGSIQFTGPYMSLADDKGDVQRRQVAHEIAALKKQIVALGGSIAAAPAKNARAAKKAAQAKAKGKASEPETSNPNGDKIAPIQAQLAKLEAQQTALAAPRTLVMQEQEKPRMSHVFGRGDFRSPGEGVEPTTPGVLHPLTGTSEAKRDRLTLARWLVSRENPLVARVMVNRLWAEVFGEGLVSTPEDFGIKGEPPSNPALLDWLAVEFMDKGWSQKALLRSIVTSATYRQDSRSTPEMLERDPTNRLLARGPRFRLSAESIRDNALAIAGLLNLKPGGSPIRPPQPDGLWAKVGGQQYPYVVSAGDEQYRRGIYVVLKRSAPYPSFVTFDATARLACRVKRPRSNTPLQALTLLNDPVYVEAAHAFAERMIREEHSSDVAARVRHGFQLALSREPNASELQVLTELYEAERQATTNQKEAWFSVASALLNLDETITKG